MPALEKAVWGFNAINLEILQKVLTSDLIFCMCSRSPLLLATKQIKQVKCLQKVVIKKAGIGSSECLCNFHR